MLHLNDPILFILLKGCGESTTEVTRAALSVRYKMLISVVLKIKSIRKAFDASLPKPGYMLAPISIKYIY